MSLTQSTRLSCSMKCDHVYPPLHPGLNALMAPNLFSSLTINLFSAVVDPSSYPVTLGSGLGGMSEGYEQTLVIPNKGAVEL